MKLFSKSRYLLLATYLLMNIATANATIYINEIYFDPPDTSGDLRGEYIELRGTPSMSLANHYLIFLENETGLVGADAGTRQGRIDAMFDLTAFSIGTNGFLTIRQAGNLYDNHEGVAAGTTDLVNTGAAFTYGSGPSSTVGFSDTGNDGKLENSGFTAMLIDIGTGSAPVLDQDLDDGDNGMSDDVFPTGWSIVDAVGVNSEADDIDGRLYADINFSAGTPTGGGNVEPGAIFVDVGYEIEYIGRWGDSTGSGREDWHVSNLTDNGLAGFSGPADFRQSGALHDTGGTDLFTETSQGVPYGTKLADTLGASNFFVRNADFDFDGDVDGADYLTWARNFGFGDGDDATRDVGDTADATGALDRVVDGGDLAVWGENFGTAAVALSAANTTSIPEPTSLGLILISVAGFTTLHRNRVKR